MKELTIDDINSHAQRALNENAKLITERWSMSMDVMDEEERLLGVIKSNLIQAENKPLGLNTVAYHGRMQEKIMGKSMDLEYYVYDCPNDSMANYVYENYLSANGVSEDGNKLVLTLYMIKHEWYMPYTEANISHELLHVLQLTKSQTLVKGAYKIASEILLGGKPHSKAETDIAWLFYLSDSSEQSAFIQEYGAWIRRCPAKLVMGKEEAEIFSLLKRYEDCIASYNANKNDKKYINALMAYRPYGYTARNFAIMIDKGLKRFKKKIKNVEKNAEGLRPLK